MECTFVFAHAVSVQVVDASGAPVCDLTVQVEHGSIEERQLTDTSCRFRAGDTTGRYVVRALRDGQLLAETTVDVPADECGLVTQDVTLVVD